MTIQPELVAATAVVRVADHPSQRSRIHRLARSGELVRVLPGTYVPASAAGDRLEVDSWEYHASQEAFELDRRRQNGLVLSGHRVLRFTATMITGEPGRVIGAVKGMRRLLRGG